MEAQTIIMIVLQHICCSIASCIGYFELFCALLFLYRAYATLCIARLLSGRCISTVRSYP